MAVPPFKASHLPVSCLLSLGDTWPSEGAPVETGHGGEILYLIPPGIAKIKFSTNRLISWHVSLGKELLFPHHFSAVLTESLSVW